MQPFVKISIIDAEYGGVESNGYRLLVTSLISKEKENCQFVVIKDRVSGKRKKSFSSYPNAKTVAFPVTNKGLAGRLAFSFLAICYSIISADVVILLGVSCGIFLPFARLFSRLKIIVNIDNTRWNQQEKGTPKQTMWKTVERLAVKFSHRIVCSNQQLRNYVKDEYNAESSVIGYGGDATVQDDGSIINNAPKIPDFPLGKKFVLCRTYISPFSGVESILETFARYPRYGIVMMGNWADSVYGLNIYKQYHRYENIRFVEYSPETFTMFLSQAEIFLYNFDGGGTHISLLQAMYQAVPVIALESPINRDITQNKAFYFSHSADLIYILHSANASMLKSSATFLAKIAHETHLWSNTVAQYFTLVESLLSPDAAIKAPKKVISGVQTLSADETKGQ
ncbi:MAG: DUF1972 domain-containing protein [Bacteroidia bacterium]